MNSISKYQLVKMHILCVAVRTFISPVFFSAAKKFKFQG